MLQFGFRSGSIMLSTSARKDGALVHMPLFAENSRTFHVPLFKHVACAVSRGTGLERRKPLGKTQNAYEIECVCQEGVL